MVFPQFDPIAFSLGPIKIYWYGIAYVLGILLGGYVYTKHLVLRYQTHKNLNKKTFEDFIPWAVFGIILGGRIGHVVFYDLSYYLQHPLEIIATWNGGMSFHGGLAGILIAIVFFTRRNNIPFWYFADILVCAAPIGLFLGRIANFINQELYGIPTQVSWAIIFPKAGDGLPRHPSQLYEAFLEGLLLFIILNFCYRFTNLRHKPGFISGLFLICYGIFRILVETVRQPDTHIGYLSFNTTLGQWLSLPLILIGIIIMQRRNKA